MNYDIRHNQWPNTPASVKTPATTAIVTVNYNTKNLVVQLIWSIYHNLGVKGFAKLLVVDNNSSDGSQSILQGLAKEGLIEYIGNNRNIYHGPALNQAFDYLSKRQNNGDDGNINAVWVLDSDCIILRSDTLVAATKLMTQQHAAIVGPQIWDTWHQGNLGLHSLLIDPAKVWRDPLKPFEEHGEPSKHLQASCAQAGLVLAPFGFTTEHYLIHVGRGTLAEIAKKQERGNRYFDWAKDHFQPHYSGEVGAETKYEEFQAGFLLAIPNFDPETVIESVKKLAQN